MESDGISLQMMMLIGLVALFVAWRLRNLFGDGE
jgi:hypothetical protein